MNPTVPQASVLSIATFLGWGKSIYVRIVPISLTILACSASTSMVQGSNVNPANLQSKYIAQQVSGGMATGFKVGEVTDTSAIVWTRLTAREHANPADGPMFEIIYDKQGKGRRGQAVKEVKYPAGISLRDVRYAAPGTNGEVKVHYRPENGDEWLHSQWQPVDPNSDFTKQFPLTELAPNTDYSVRVEGRVQGSSTGVEELGRFRTAPAPDTIAKVMFTVSTGQAFRDKDREDGFEIYPSMQKLNPSFFVHTGDIVYYDRLAKNREMARYHWQRTYSLPTNVAFHRNVASYFIKDDHDAWTNDCWPTMKTLYMGEFTFVEGLKIFREQIPMGRSTYRTRRWGRDLQVWMVEGRDFRSPNTDSDGPEKTIWGEEQKAWFKQTVADSNATFRILISPTPIVGPDRDHNKHDNHSNKDFKHEGDEIRDFLATQENLIVICGDRHWQYHSIDPRTKVREYSCGPASDQHAGGWKQEDYRKDYHRYLNVIGGFLSATVDRNAGVPSLTMRFHDVSGEVQYEDVLTEK